MHQPGRSARRACRVRAPKDRRRRPAAARPCPSASCRARRAARAAARRTASSRPPQQQADRAGGWRRADGSPPAPAGAGRGRLSQSGNSRRITPPRSPVPRPVMTSTQRTWSACAVSRKACRAWNARCAVRPCRSSVRAGPSLPERSRFQTAVVQPARMVADGNRRVRDARPANGAVSAPAARTLERQRASFAAVPGIGRRRTAGERGDVAGVRRPFRAVRARSEISVGADTSARGRQDRRRPARHAAGADRARQVPDALDVGRARRAGHQHDVARHEPARARPRARRAAGPRPPRRRPPGGSVRSTTMAVSASRLSVVGRSGPRAASACRSRRSPA